MGSGSWGGWRDGAKGNRRERTQGADDSVVIEGEVAG